MVDVEFQLLNMQPHIRLPMCLVQDHHFIVHVGNFSLKWSEQQEHDFKFLERGGQ